MRIVEVGQIIRRGWGFYSDQVECLANPAHRVLWWYAGVWCLDCHAYVRAKTKERQYSDEAADRQEATNS